ncbi:MAG TPA: sugar phosphate nucleotidyltransferase [Acidimicrobiales bacterium]|nr:sugar phosphate nucleotidyltransferase [Acidimicrobiales bacterium]
MKAVIMAGGEGTRLRPLTSNQPKPMLPMANRPMMEHVVNLLRRHGLEDIVVTVAFMPNSIRTYFGDGSELGVRMVYATEETPLGTAGSVLNARDELDERFLVISGDVLTDIDLTAVVEFHERKGALATLALCAVENPLEFGIVITREDGSIDRFLEKPTWGQVFSDTINTGIYVLEPEIFDHIPADRAADFSGEVFPEVLGRGGPLYGYVAEGYWEDVGTTEAYLRAHQDVLDSKVQVDIGGFEIRPGVWVGKGCTIDPAATIEGPAVIDDNCTIGAGVVLGEYSTLGSNVRIADGAEVRRSVVHDNAYFGPGVRVAGAVIGRSCDLRRGATCEPGSVLGEGCLIGAHAHVRGDVKVYPFKTVETGAVVNSSIVWESRGPRSLFGSDGVRGIANVDISPELVVRLSMAWASTLDRGMTITASRDTSRAARVLKRAAMIGCNAAGVNVEDLEVATVPLTRHHIRTSGNQGGITVRLAQDDPQSVIIRFFDEEGLDLAEGGQRKVERLYHREDFRRVLAGQIGDIDFPARAVEQYTKDMTGAVDLSAARAANMKIVLDLSYGAASFVMPNLLAKLDADVLVVNPYAHTTSMMAVERDVHARRVADLVRASGAQLGAVIDADCEGIVIVDDAGTVLSDDQALLALLVLVVETRHDLAVALPVGVSRWAETICAEAGVPITFTKMSSAHVMEVAASGEVGFAASQSGGFVWPEILPAYDAAATLVELVSMLSLTGQPLSKIVDDLPAVHIAKEAVMTPWEQKGMVMRTLVEQLDGQDLVLIDGVKVPAEDGWALVLPDPDEPVTHVWAEGPSEARARARAQQYAVRLRQLLRSGG